MSDSDRQRWNARYGGGFAASFRAHPLADQALGMALPAGPVLDLASGPSGAVLVAAAAGRRGVAVDISDLALGLLRKEVIRRGLTGRIDIVQADLDTWRPQPDTFALVLCTGFWARELFVSAAQAVLPGGLVGWEALTEAALRTRPGMPAEWCLGPGEPACLLPPGYEVITEQDVPDGRGDTRRRQMLARRLETA